MMITRLFERRRTALLSAAAFLIVAGAGGAVGAQGSDDKSPSSRGKPRTAVVATELGPVTGFVDGGTRNFLGIPYAAPPVGDLRWRPPQSPAFRRRCLTRRYSATPVRRAQ